MPIATAEGIFRQRTVSTLGLMLGLAVRSRGLGGNIMAGFHALGDGDALAKFGDVLAAARQVPAGAAAPVGHTHEFPAPGDEWSAASRLMPR